MINWNKQTDDMLQALTDTQKKFWSIWTEAAEQQASQAQLAETWRKAVDAWEAAVKNSLETQKAVVRSVGDGASAVPAIPQDLLDWTAQTQALSSRWTEAQSELWESWFGMVRKAVPVKMLGTIDDENQKLFAVWQESVEKIGAAQLAWAQKWTERAASAAPKSTGTTAKAKPAAKAAA
ncbi:MAG: hypothetical protein OXG04_02905 [Acidobacteria bacterium]|nr:hypothetical protein [Acidobacteriota bacterium]